jgi:predicted DNA-binding mobile mystery protein A
MARFIEDQILIDEKAASLKAVKFPQPRAGWIRTIRTALRMSQAELATLLQMNQKSLHQLETSEANMKIRLESLEKVANALDCELVYAFVPRKSLHERYQERAHEIASAQLKGVGHTMALENQAVKFSRKKVDALAARLIANDTVHWSVDV